MTNFYRDDNDVPVAGGISSTSSTTTLPFTIDSVTGRLLTSSGSGTANLVVGTSTITGGTTTRVLFDNAGVLGEYAISGTGSVAMTTSPTIATPTVTTSLTVSSADIITDTTTGTKIGTATTQKLGFFNATPIVQPSAVDIVTAIQNLGLGASLTNVVAGITVGTSTITGGANTRILYDNSGVLGEYTITGTGTVVAMQTSPSFTTPTLGVASATTINKVTITAPATGSTLTIADGKTLTANASITLAGTDGKSLTLTNGLTVTTNDGTLAFGAASKTLTVNNSIALSGTDGTTMTFPTTSKTVAANDGSNWTFTSQAIGDLVYASSTTAFTRLAAVATGQVLVSAGTGTAPAWSANPQVTTIELGNASDTTLARVSAGVISVEGVTVPTISSTNTLTNKRITRRLTTTNAPGATPTTNTDNVDVMNFTGLNTAITSMTTNLSGTPSDGDLLEFRFLDDGTARAITWGTSFASTTVTLPTTTVISTCLRVGFEWRAASSKWECIATC